MSPTSYLAAPPRDIVAIGAEISSSPEQLNYNTKNKYFCQLFFCTFSKKTKKIFRKVFFSEKDGEKGKNKGVFTVLFLLAP